MQCGKPAETARALLSAHAEAPGEVRDRSSTRGLARRRAVNRHLARWSRSTAPVSSSLTSRPISAGARAWALFLGVRDRAVVCRAVFRALRQDGGVREDQALAAVVAAAERRGLSSGDATVLRVGENGVVALPSELTLARVVAGTGRLYEVRKEITLAKWLLTNGIPAAQPRVDEPDATDGYVVSFWHYFPDASSADLETLAQMLLNMHALPAPPDDLLQRVQPFARFDQRLTAAAAALTPADQDLLRRLRGQYIEQWQMATFAGRDVVLHGDAHMDNVLKTGPGTIAVIDLEEMCLGPREWDLTLTALYYECGWFTDEQYQRFVAVYGYDVRQSRWWHLLRGIRMVRMVTWPAQSAVDDPGRKQQLQWRLQTLRDGTAPGGWSGY